MSSRQITTGSTLLGGYARPKGLLVNGKLFVRSQPQYEKLGAADFLVATGGLLWRYEEPKGRSRCRREGRSEEISAIIRRRGDKAQQYGKGEETKDGRILSGEGRKMLEHKPKSHI